MTRAEHAATSPSLSADVVVFGGTAGGVVAAIAAAREGAHVVLVEPGGHLGGMLTGGLSRTDIERQEPLVGGIALEVFRRLGTRYGLAGPAWRFEPRVAEAVLRELADEAGVDVRFGQALSHVERSGDPGRIEAIVCTTGTTFPAHTWIDASYEGDLLAAAGVPFAIGRESRSAFGESLAGRREILPNPHQFRAPVSALDDDGRLLPRVEPYESIGELGHGDGKVQAYCFRICLSTAEDRIPIGPPAGYDRAEYRLLERYLESLGREGARLDQHDVIGISDIPNHKSDVNSHGPVSTDLLGGSWGYLEADTAGRARIHDEHRRWAAGLLYFLATDPAVPGVLQDHVARRGYPPDEFTDTGHWPHQLYVREGRRMLGEHVLSQADLLGGSVPGDTVGMAGYNIDVREVQWVACPISRFPEVHREVLVEGYLSVPVRAYGIPYRCLLPPARSVGNLLVSTCVSSSAIAFASFRMEPQFMIAGHAAGVAAAQAARRSVDVRNVDVDALRVRLRAAGQVLQPA